MAFDDMAWGIDEITENVKTGIIPIVKSIQTGTYTFTSAANATININSVNPDKTIVLLNSQRSSYSRSTGTDRTDYTCISYQSCLVSKTATSITISPNYDYEVYSNSDGSNAQNYFGAAFYQIIEFY